ncbi:MAG: thiamine-phosphate synthase family protein, partial [Candidatus Hodarchaeales archaeon]
MQFACEIVPSNYLTPLRRILAKELTKQEYTQVEIARILGVSQPVVSSYLKSSETGASIITSRPKFKTLVSNLLIHVEKGLTSPTGLMEMMCVECQKFRIAGPICDIHRKETSFDFPPDCSICFPSPDQAAVFGKKLEITKELYEAALQLIAMEEKFGQLIPEIGCQFVYIVEGSNLQENIANFPGRIVKLKGKGKIVSYPEFGQSSTLAMILSYFQQQNSPYRAIISLRSTSEN